MYYSLTINLSYHFIGFIIWIFTMRDGGELSKGTIEAEKTKKVKGSTY
jgi:hypothetical protein